MSLLLALEHVRLRAQPRRTTLFNLLVDTNETDLTYHAACCSMGTSIATMLHDMMLQIESEAVERSERGLLGLARLTRWSPIMQETYCLFA